MSLKAHVGLLTRTAKITSYENTAAHIASAADVYADMPQLPKAMLAKHGVSLHVLANGDQTRVGKARLNWAAMQHGGKHHERRPSVTVQGPAGADFSDVRIEHCAFEKNGYSVISLYGGEGSGGEK